jgi:hypothetical protein
MHIYERTKCIQMNFASTMTPTGIVHLQSIFMCDFLFVIQLRKGKESVVSHKNLHVISSSSLRYMFQLTYQRATISGKIKQASFNISCVDTRVYQKVPRLNL